MKATTNIVTTICFVTALFIAAQTSSAQDNAAGIHLGYNTDVEEIFIGLHGRFDVTGLFGPGLRLISNPAAELYFIEDLTFMQFDINLLLPFGAGRAGGISPYAGAGLAVLYASDDITDTSSTDLGLNLLGGLVFNAGGRFQPFLQARYTALEGDYLTLSGGVAIGF